MQFVYYFCSSEQLQRIDDICKGSILRFVEVNKNETKDNKAVNVLLNFYISVTIYTEYTDKNNTIR